MLCASAAARGHRRCVGQHEGRACDAPATARSAQGGRAAASLVSRPGPVSGPHTTGGAGRPVRPKGGAERQEAGQGVPLGPTEDS